MNRFRQWDFWLWGLAVVAVVLNAALGNYNIDTMVATDQRVTHTRSVQREFISLLSDIKDAETGHRGYLLTGTDEYLAPFRIAEASYPAHFDNLKSLTEDIPDQRRRLADTDALVQAKFREMTRTIEIRKQLGLEPAAHEVSIGHGKELMERIRELVAGALVDETARLELRVAQAREQIVLARVATIVAASLAIAIILVAATLIRSEFRRRLDVNGALIETKGQLEIANDVLRESEARYRYLSEQLEQMVRERTGELRDQARLLKASNEELETFAYIASHDLQEPLRKIQSFGDRLLKKNRDQLDAGGQDSVDRMLDAAGRMRRLIEDLLAFSRVTTRTKPFEPADLNAVLAEVRATFDDRLEQCGGRLAIDPLPSLPGDAFQLRQLFQNLIGNAIKFAQTDRPPVFEVTAVAFDDLSGDADPPRPDGAGWRIAVRDNGIGFEQQYSDRIFELFQRLHGRHKYEGTGLGLAICKKITVRHGIALQVRSKPGEGTAFTLDWPLSAPERLTHAPPQTGDDPAGGR